MRKISIQQNIWKLDEKSESVFFVSRLCYFFPPILARKRLNSRLTVKTKGFPVKGLSSKENVTENGEFKPKVIDKDNGDFGESNWEKICRLNEYRV